MTGTVTTVSLRTVEGSWNATRNCRNYSYPEHGEIRPAVARRLVDYAARALTDAGFGPILDTCSVEVLTTDGDRPAAERAYQVTFKTPADGTLSVDQILMGRGGWPILDHGFTASRP